MEKVRREAGAMHVEASSSEPRSTPQYSPASPLPSPTQPARVAAELRSENNSAHGEIAALREQVNSLKQELADVRAELESTSSELRRDLDELNRQLGN
jgi:molecular chaperone GrpE (heat shock protein)